MQALDRRRTMLMHTSRTQLIVKTILLCLGTLTLFLALLHPRWGLIQETVHQRSRDVLIALDISRSMLTADVAPNRLTCAQHALKHLINRLSSDRIALILFCDKARSYCPLTRDKELACMFLDTIDPTCLGTGSTRLDQPIYAAIEQCKRAPDKKQRLLVLATDGEDFSGSLESVKTAAQQEHVNILVLGVGTSQGAPIALKNEAGASTGYLKDEQGHVVISKLNEQALQQLAQETGGIYRCVNTINPDIDALVHAIEQHEKDQRESQTFSTYQEQYQWFVLVGFLCFLLEWIL